MFQSTNQPQIREIVPSGLHLHGTQHGHLSHGSPMGTQGDMNQKAVVFLFPSLGYDTSEKWLVKRWGTRENSMIHGDWSTKMGCKWWFCDDFVMIFSEHIGYTFTF